MPIFYHFQDISIYSSKNYIFCRFTQPVSYEAIVQGISRDLGYESWSQKTGVSGQPVGENGVILRSLVLSQCQRLTDEHAAYHNKNNEVSNCI